MNAQAQVTASSDQPTLDDTPPHWGAQIKLQMTCDGERSYLSDVRHEGPLRIQRPFYPEGRKICHVYLLHPPGGLVSGDELQIDIRLQQGAQGLVTTPSAGKVYRANARGTLQSQRTRLRLQAGAQLDWLPQENIIFDRASAALELDIDLHPTARLFAWELVCLGRPHSGEQFTAGRIRQRFKIFSEGQPLFVDQYDLRGGDASLQAMWGLQGFCCVGTFVVACADTPIADLNAWIEQLREQLPYHDELRCSFTRLKNLLVMRVLGKHTESSREAMIAAWEFLRPRVSGREACKPRIWNT